MNQYPFKDIESKWQKHWDSSGVNHTDLNDIDRKLYVLVMFSYPSEKKLHIGHWYNYAPVDTFARFKKMQGWNVFEPMGFDAFGLPAENYAIKNKSHPMHITRESVSFITEQLKQIGAMYDWDRAVNTSQSDYYKWTQWLFLKLYEHKAAYKKKAPVNWCPSCLTVLANEQVLGDGSCERCGTMVAVKKLEQWFLRITDFADKLLEGLERVDWPEATKAMQRHWIGRSEGTEIEFSIADSDLKITTFTTRSDTLYGVTYLVLAPEHPFVSRIVTPEQSSEVDRYIEEARRKSDIERATVDRIKTGVFTGAYAIHPATNERISIWIADYVLATYGTGAVMAVPAHDQRDYEFANKYKLLIRSVIKPKSEDELVPDDCAYEDYGIMYNSDRFNGLSSEIGIRAVAKWLEERGQGGSAVSYRLRDWLISRQRYWGAPIPIIYCDKCGTVPVPEDQLPVLLPENIEDFTPKGTSPLGACEKFMNVECPKCKGAATRDPDTMDTFVDSSWYFLRYPSANVAEVPYDKETTLKWLPVDVYVGGPEHATGHLIYARYITKFLHSIGELEFDEPFTRLIHQGIITNKGQRMSKSKGNVVNPDKFIEKYGSDCFRLYIMFMGDYTAGGDWSDEGIVGVRRFQNRIWRLFEEWVTPIKERDNDVVLINDTNLRKIMHYTIKMVSVDLDRFQFNTAISRVMEFVNGIYEYIKDEKNVNLPFMEQILHNLSLVVAPLAPHLGEEIWSKIGGKGSVFEQRYPEWNEDYLKEDQVNIAVQMNGKLIGTMSADVNSDKDVIVKMALELPKVQNKIADRKFIKAIYIQDKLINLVYN